VKAELLRAIVDEPDVVEHWHPLADYLQQQDDPRGELIAIDLALEHADAAAATPLVLRRTEILAVAAPRLLGDTFAKVVAEGYGTIAWRRGFVDAVSYIGSASLGHKRSVGWLVRLMTQTFEPFVLLRRLSLRYTDLADVTPLLGFAHLVELDLAHTDVRDVAALRALPRLRTLDVAGTRVTPS